MEGRKCFGLERQGQGELSNLPCFIQTPQANPDRRPSAMTEYQKPNRVLGASQRLGICDPGFLHMNVVKVWGSKNIQDRYMHPSMTGNHFQPK